MDREFWIDGFNFFHHWESTRGLLRTDSGLDIARALERSLRILARHLGSKGRHTVVFMDGGLSRSEGRSAGLRTRYCGPGRKADDRLADELAELGDQTRMITAVSNDRELKARLRLLGASCLGVGEFLALLEGKSHASGGRKGGGKTPGKRPGKGVSGGRRTAGEEEVMRQKTRSLSTAEVDAWLDYFGGDIEA